MKQKYYANLSFLRAVACVAIVVLHTVNSAAILYEGRISRVDYGVSMAVVEALAWAVPCFLMVTGALLLDVGIGRCHAPDILCEGTEPYIAHGIIGAEMLRKLAAENGRDLECYARICERHTGTGLTAADILRLRLSAKYMR